MNQKIVGKPAQEKMTSQTESLQFSVIRKALNKQEGIELYLSNSLLISR